MKHWFCDQQNSPFDYELSPEKAIVFSSSLRKVGLELERAVENEGSLREHKGLCLHKFMCRPRTEVFFHLKYGETDMNASLPKNER